MDSHRAQRVGQRPSIPPDFLVPKRRKPIQPTTRQAVDPVGSVPPPHHSTGEMTMNNISITSTPVPGMQHITITPTLGNQRFIATMMLRSQNEDGCEIEPSVLDWINKVLNTELTKEEIGAIWEYLNNLNLQAANAILRALIDNKFNMPQLINNDLLTIAHIMREFINCSVLGIVTYQTDFYEMLFDDIKDKCESLIFDWAAENMM
jgi:hypothetical protein